MKHCWVLVVTRGLRLWLPPEVYLTRDLALKEVDRWQTTFRVPSDPPPLTNSSRYLRLLRTWFPEPWRACPVWVGIYWSERSYPRMRFESMAADEREAEAWLRRRTPTAARIVQLGQVEFRTAGRADGRWSVSSEAG